VDDFLFYYKYWLLEQSAFSLSISIRCRLIPSKLGGFILLRLGLSCMFLEALLFRESAWLVQDNDPITFAYTYLNYFGAEWGDS
jgi:hypothetical protein